MNTVHKHNIKMNTENKHNIIQLIKSLIYKKNMIYHLKIIKLILI